ncbi:MAG: endonuclease/exonuclease/phosphatase family protein, partial [Pseudomonadota bacterium]
MQLNIRNWYSNKYLLSVELGNCSPDVILLNETSAPNNDIKLRGYYVIQYCAERYSGVAILIKNSIQFSIIPININNTLAVKIYTSLGPLIICTSYIPPRINSIPTIQLNKILNLKLPTIFVSDFNAHHRMFNNCARRQSNDTRGSQLARFVLDRNVHFLGPDFDTYRAGGKRGKPDLVLCSNDFRLFHHRITQGNNVGSDHLPIIIKISTKPIKIIVNRSPNIKLLNTNGYKQELSQIEFSDLNNQPVKAIDESLNLMHDKIKIAINNN